jgi:hypothetical protein
VGPLLKRGKQAAALAASLAASAAFAQGDQHEFHFDASAGFVSTSTDLRAWPDGGFSKLRYDDDAVEAFRLFGEYHGRITNTWRSRIVFDYVSDASGGFDLTEAAIDWRPIPRSQNQHQLKVGAFYPAFSLENGDRGWESPFTYTYSAINTWLGEEIRPFGAEWSVRRRLQGFRSNHEVRGFAAAFYGNDPAGTLLFWRGWGLHDRQSRLNDELEIPPRPFATQPQKLEPFRELDHRPGYYGGVEWRFARRALVQLARYDNRADPFAFSGGQWGWGTDFTHLAVQVDLPAELGLVAQWMSGTTEWLTAALPDGTRSPMSERVHDEFDARFVLLTRRLGAAQRVTLRYDTFSIERPAATPVLRSDRGNAWTLNYRVELAERLSGGIEWLRVESQRDLLPLFYATAAARTEDQVRVELSYRLAAPTR